MPVRRARKPVQSPAAQAPAGLPTHDEIVRWLKAKRISMWGAPFLMEKERSSDCADWIQDQIASFLAWREAGCPDRPVDKESK